jgi:glycosyltransferase involved in cell wall biosynthesis
MTKFATIIITHWSGSADRSNFLRKSLESLKSSTKIPYELIVVDNGGNIDDSKFLLELADKGEINTYVRNHNNMHFGFARNQALRISNGDPIVISDNDIIYNPGWLEACIEVLDAHPDEKIYATPVYNVAHWRPKFWVGELEVNDKTYRLNMRAGSNCFVVRRKDFETIGDFYIHRVAGTKWTNRALSFGYYAAVTPDIMVNDFGFRKGYNLNDPKPVKLSLQGGKEVYFNQDEFVANQGLEFVEQKTFKHE